MEAYAIYTEGLDSTLKGLKQEQALLCELIGVQFKYRAPLQRNYSQILVLKPTMEAYSDIVKNLSECAKSGLYSSDFIKRHADTLLGLQIGVQNVFKVVKDNQIMSPELVDSMHVATETAKTFNEDVLGVDAEKVKVAPKQVKI